MNKDEHKLRKKVERYNRLAEKWGFPTMRFDIKWQRYVPNGSELFNEVEDKKTIIANILCIIDYQIKYSYLKHLAYKIYDLDRKVHPLRQQYTKNK